MRKEVLQALEILPERSRFRMKRGYRLIHQCARTLEQAARVMRVTREQVRLGEEQELGRLKDAGRILLLQDPAA